MSAAALADDGSFYGPSPIKRNRSTKAELAALNALIVDLIVRVGPPVTIRQINYMCVAEKAVPKSDSGYEKVMRQIGSMRESGQLPWSWIADNTRWVRQPSQWEDVDTAIKDMHEMYRRDYWRTQSTRVEVWVESDSIASFVHAITDEYGVPLFACRGQASRTFIWQAAEEARLRRKPVEVLFIGDWDPTGLQIDVSLAERYRRYGDMDLKINRIAVTPDDIRDLGLVGGPPKKQDSNYQRFLRRCIETGVPALSVETEAIPPNILRDRLRAEIVARIDARSWQIAERVEEQERDLLGRMLGNRLGNPYEDPEVGIV